MEAEPTSYFGDSLVTAYREVAAAFGRAPINLRAFRGWRAVWKDIAAADLSDPGERRRLGVTEAELMADPHPEVCIRLARKLRKPESGCQALLYKSKRNEPRGVCLALFLERISERELIRFEPIEDEEWEEFVRQQEGP